MRKPVVLEGPGSTPEEYAREVGMSRERQAMLLEIIDNLDRRKKPARSGKSNNKPAAKPRKKAAPQTCPA